MGGGIMAGLAQSTKSNTVRIIKVKDKQEFTENFNSGVPSKEFLDKCSNSAKIAGEKNENK